MPKTRSQTNATEHTSTQRSLQWRWMVDAELEKAPVPDNHPVGWSPIYHYMNADGQCGQSCPCCRARVFKLGIDEDAKHGACPICLKQNDLPFFEPRK